MSGFKFWSERKSKNKWIKVVLCGLVALAAVGTANASTIEDAVDTTEFTWTTGGDANWFYQTSTTHDGNDAAQSGTIGASQSTWMQTGVTGSGTLVFWWKVSSEERRGVLAAFLRPEWGDLASLRFDPNRF